MDNSVSLEIYITDNNRIVLVVEDNEEQVALTMTYDIVSEIIEALTEARRALLSRMN